MRSRRILFMMGAILIFAMPELLPAPAAAQSAVKRSGTSGSRGSGSLRRSTASTRRSAPSARRSVGPSKQGKSEASGNFRGRGELTETRRESFTEDDSDWEEAGDAGDWGGREGRGGSASDDDASDSVTEEAEDFGARTLGKSCMYGRGGEVIFRPAGALCRGDRKAPRAERKQPATKAQAAPKSRSASAARPAAPSPSPSSEKRGSCIRGGDGRVLYAPPGVNCRR